jgi:hypothetical protein
LGLGAGLFLVGLVLCGLAYLVTQPGVSFVTGPAWTPPVLPQGEAAVPAAGTAAPPGVAGIQVGGRAMVSADVNRANLRREWRDPRRARGTTGGRQPAVVAGPLP